MKPGKIDVTRLRPAKSKAREDTETVIALLFGVLVIGCCCGGGAVAALWAVIG